MKKLLLSVCGLLSSLSLLVSPNSSVADELRYIPTGESALMEMAHLIQNARHTIDLTYFILDPCSRSGKVLLSLLVKKSTEEGVRVRILVDAFTHSWDTRNRLTAYLRQKNIEIRYFNVRVKLDPKITFRSHVKLLLADSKEYITGGRNIAEDYFSLAKGLNFIDRDIYVRGDSALQAQEDFNVLWNSPYTHKEPARHTVLLDRFVNSCLKWTESETNLLNTINSRAKTVIASRKTVTCSDVRFVSDDPAFIDQNSGLPLDESMTVRDFQKKHSTRELLRLIKETKSILTLENWSYDPWAYMRTSINELRYKNIPVFVITNRVTDVGGSMDYRNVVGVSRDNWGSQYIRTLSYRGSMRDAWDKTPSESFFMLHSKVFVSDDKTTAISSYNIDGRSYHYNLESAVIARNCPAFAHEALKSFAQLNANFEKDESCVECQRPPSFKLVDRLKAILGAGYY